SSASARVPAAELSSQHALLDAAVGILAPGGEKLLEQRRGASFADAADYLRRMMAGRLLKEPGTVLNRTALGSAAPEEEARTPGTGDGRGAQGARLERDVEVAVHEPR